MLVWASVAKLTAAQSLKDNVPLQSRAQFAARQVLRKLQCANRSNKIMCSTGMLKADVSGQKMQISMTLTAGYCRGCSVEGV